MYNEIVQTHIQRERGERENERERNYYVWLVNLK